ncbi:MAG: YciI family protein [Bryobacterales bacterium]|nr:YciI family protein [Bryobacterales bacterium]
MRFMLIRKADEKTEAGELPGVELINAMMKYNQEMAEAGVFLDGAGLRPSAAGARVKITGGKPAVTDGPFVETKELIAGFTLIQTKSKEEAIEWVKRWPIEDAPVEIEIRQLFEPEDFGPEAVAAVREFEKKFI